MFDIFLTFLIGFLITKYIKKKKIHKKELEEIFEKDFKKALDNFNRKLKFLTSNKKEAELLIEMIFQLGIKGCLKFNNLLKNMRKGNIRKKCFYRHLALLIHG